MRRLLAIATLAACGCAQQPARFIREIEWSEQGSWVKSDTHIHTQFSDGGHTVAEVISQANDYGCDVVAITDHGDENLDAASPAYADAIRIARRQFPNMVIIAGIEWNVPPSGGEDHATVLLPDDANEFRHLAHFKEQFDDFGRSSHDPQRAIDGLEWLDAEYSSGSRPVVIYNHPSREAARSLDAATHMRLWRQVNDIVIGFSGAPGHQSASTIGSYSKGAERTIDRWDPVAARIGDAWDSLLQEGIDVWGARADSDYHGRTDYWPGQFSETWLFVPERTVTGVLAAMRAGTFFAAHGQIARNVDFQLYADGLTRAAHVGESIEVSAGAELRVRLELDIPKTDWSGRPNRIDDIELIAITQDSVEVISLGAPSDDTVAEWTGTAPNEGLVLRARGRRTVKTGPDLLFYTNPIRVEVAAGLIPPKVLEWFSIPRVVGLSLLLVATIAVFARLNRGRPPSGNSPSNRIDVIGRRPDTQARMQETAKAAESVRRGCAIAAACYAAFLAYGSLVPFHFESMSLEEGIRRFATQLAMTTDRPGRVDFGINVALFIPFTLLLMASLSERSRALALTVTVAIVSSVSLSIECGQMWIADRVASRWDVFAHALGAVVGLGLWTVYGRRGLAATYGFVSKLTPGNRIYWLLQAYVIGLVAYNWLPLDLTIHPGDLYRKIQRGRVVLMPFANLTLSSETIWESIIDGLTFIPVGAFCYLLVRRSPGGRFPRVEAWFLGVLIAVGLEFVQLFVMSRFTESGDILVAACGVALGVLLAGQLAMESNSSIANTEQPSVVVWCFGTVAYATFLFAFFWWPFDLVTEKAVIQERLSLFVDLPFRKHLSVSYFNGLATILQRVLLLIPLGGLVWFATSAIPNARWRAVIGIVAVAGFGLTIELGQLVYANRIADITDVLLFGLGGAIGVLVASRTTRRSVELARAG